MKLKINIGATDLTTIELDQLDITRHVRSLELELNVAHQPFILLDLAIPFVDVDLDGPAEYTVDPSTAAILTRLGWTKPGQTTDDQILNTDGLPTTEPAPCYGYHNPDAQGICTRCGTKINREHGDEITVDE